MVLWEDYLNNIASYMGVDATSAGIIVSCMITVATVLVATIATKGRYGMSTLLIGYLGLTVFTVAGWLPYWIMLMFTLVVAGMYANQIKRWFGG